MFRHNAYLNTGTMKTIRTHGSMRTIVGFGFITTPQSHELSTYCAFSPVQSESNSTAHLILFISISLHEIIL